MRAANRSISYAPLKLQNYSILCVAFDESIIYYILLYSWLPVYTYFLKFFILSFYVLIGVQAKSVLLESDETMKFWSDSLESESDFVKILALNSRPLGRGD